MTKYLPAAASLPHPGPYHVAQRLQEPLVVLDVLGFVLGVASRVDHPARLAAHGPEMLLPGILGEKRRWIKRGARGLGFKTTLGRRNEGRKGLWQQKSGWSVWFGGNAGRGAQLFACLQNFQGYGA